MKLIEQARHFVRSQFRTAKAAEITPADALARAHEHTIAATRAIAALPDRQEDSVGHAKGIATWHAHVKSAVHYLETVRSDVAGLLAGDDDDDATVAEFETEDPEARAQRETTRVHAATVLLGAFGNIDGAAKLLPHSTTPPRR